MTTPMASSRAHSAMPAERTDSVQFAVAVRKNVHWISLLDTPGHGIEPPELPECVTDAVRALAAAGGTLRWLMPFTREAANILVTGPEADRVADAISGCGAREKIVRCAGRDDMQRVARVLALGGDYVVVDDDAMLIFPPWF